MQLKLLAETLEDIRHQNGEEYWFARDLWSLLGYASWRNFKPAIERAIESCKTSGEMVEHHFASIRKMVDLGSGSQREVDDYKLTRYACYLIAQNGDPRIPEIAFSQMYFAMQTRKQEVLEQNAEEIERMIARRKLGETEKEFAKTIYERGVDGRGIGEIKSSGDHALFGGHDTRAMKKVYRLSDEKPLADVLPSVTLKAKDLATEMTTLKTKRDALQGKHAIKAEHIKNNYGVRKALIENQIFPERLAPVEDIKAVESRHKKQARLAAKNGLLPEVQ